MKLIDALPQSVLAPFVECYWYVQAGADETSPFGDAIVPNGTSNLIFNLSGNPHHEFGSVVSQTLTSRWIAGIRGSVICVNATGETEVVGIRFKAGGMFPFASTMPGELAAITVDPDIIWGRECVALHEELFDADTTTKMFELLERWLLSRFHFNRLSHEEGLFRALERLRQTNGQLSVARLAAEADLSPRQLRRRFERTVGLTPKLLGRVLRFQHLIQLIDVSNPTVPWATLAAECGYFDQAHLIADFHDFAGVTPTQYVARKPHVPGFLPLDQPMTDFSNT